MRDALLELLTSFDADLNRRPDVAAASAPGADLHHLLRQVLRRAADVSHGKVAVVQAITPREGSTQKLATAFFHNFGGFFDERYRQHDFLLGWENAAEWLDTLCATYSDPRLKGAADRCREDLAKVQRRYGREPFVERTGPDLAERWLVTRVVVRAWNVVLSDLFSAEGPRRHRRKAAQPH